ncbi:hypothetical protein [Klebsiella quasipneumoniae]|uniref:hypothetical protein n=1 Tax=Klebsiella quasipneumoniae TaxID=1463165 RepID=UPI0031EF6FDD
MTSKLTIEQAKRLRNDFECWQQDYDPKDDKEQYDMFGRGMVAMDMLIAGMYQEPVAYTDERNLGYIDRRRETAYLWGKQNSEASDVALYRHAQPAPVVPENCVTAEHRRVIEMLLNVCGAAFELADDSCQQDVDGEDCHVVPDDAFQKLSDALDEIENTLPTEDIDRPDVFLAWSAIPRAALKSLLQAQPVPVVVAEAQSRAAMLKAQPQNAPQNIPEIIPGWIPVSEQKPDCWCRICRPVVLNDMRFVVCPDCGNKRCPRANDHRNACTGSNEPGQEGSAYPAAPQEVGDA